MLAAYAGNKEAFEFLLGHGADPNSLDLAGNSVLMGAAFRGHLEMVKRLVEAGADVTVRNKVGVNASGFAETFGRLDVVALLSSARPSHS